MRNRMYGGVRGRKTQVGRKLLRFPPTRLYIPLASIATAITTSPPACPVIRSRISPIDNQPISKPSAIIFFLIAGFEIVVSCFAIMISQSELPISRFASIL